MESAVLSTRLINEEYPICMTHGKGAYIMMRDGNDWLLTMLQASGLMILGYAPEPVCKCRRKRTAGKGAQFSTPTEDLCKLAKKLTEIIPCAEMVAFQSSGQKQHMHAWRVARAHTGKMKIVKSLKVGASWMG